MRTKFAVLGLVLIIALAGLSVGYAYWTETLYINGTVATGNLSVAFADPITTSDSDGTDQYGGSCSASVSNVGTENETLNIAVTNAYPGYYCTVNFNVKNDGSIPVDLNGIALGTIDPGLTVQVTNDVDRNNLAVNATEDGALKLTVGSEVAEGANLTMSATILAEQFNAD